MFYKLIFKKLSFDVVKYHGLPFSEGKNAFNQWEIGNEGTTQTRFT